MRLDESTDTGVAHSRNWLAVVFVLMLIEVAGYFEHAMVLGGIPFFANLFGIDYAAASWIITIFMLTGAASAIVGGKLGDMYGRKRMVLILLTISIIGSLITIAFASFPALLVGRALQGTSAGILPLLIGIARQVLPAKRVPVVIAMMTAVATITGGVGLFIAGMFIDAGAWRLMFAASATFCYLRCSLHGGSCRGSRRSRPGRSTGWGQRSWLRRSLSFSTACLPHPRAVSTIRSMWSASLSEWQCWRSGPGGNCGPRRHWWTFAS